MKNISLILAVFLTACGTPRDLKRTIKIESEPTGARIFVGTGATESEALRVRNYLGTAPLDWVTVAGEDGSFVSEGSIFVFSELVPHAVVFSADPPSGHTNLFPKRQIFHTGTQWKRGDKVPEGLFFDLTQPDPEPPAKKKK